MLAGAGLVRADLAIVEFLQMELVLAKTTRVLVNLNDPHHDLGGLDHVVTAPAMTMTALTRL